MNIKRCQWVGGDPLMIKYHDREWGVPTHSDRRLFMALVLDGAQAGLSWSTVLKKRENYKKAFDNFDPVKIAKYTARDIKRLLNNPGIIRNRLKIASAITNARAFLKIKKEFGSFDKYIWSFVKYRPIKNKGKKVADRMSEDLKKRGFKFCGSTICYAFMQAEGLVNDHTTDCFRYQKML